MLQKIELTACEKESFHVPSSIQMHGFLLAVQDDDFSIVQVSNNLEHFLKRDPYSLLGLNLQEIIGINNYDYLKEQLATQNFLHEINPLSVTFIIANQKQTFDVTLHHSEKILILEFEPVSLVTVNQAELFYQTSQKAVMRLQAAANLPDLFAKLTQEVKQLTGFDQVMLYQFANGYGKIIAEAKEPRFQSYYEYCYPINDIPLQALTMCIKNKLRIIPDVNYTPSVLISANYPIIETALDLSNAVLRGVSPTHIQDLKTMGVKASLTISIVTNNTLWGVIVCHHTQPKLIAYKIRSACELLSQVVSWQIAALQALVTNEELTARQQILNLIYESFRENVPWYESLLAQQTSLLNLIKAQGIALCHEGQCLLWGKTPSEQQVIKLFNYISLLTTEQVYENACISNTFPEAKDYKEWAAGMIASVLSPTDGDFIIWFRPGLLPTTTLERNPPLLRIIEQNSTDVSLSQPLAWQALTSYALPWSKAEIETVKQLTRFLTEMKLKHFDRTAYEYQIKKTVLIEERANKQQKFIETLCHEIRNPINGILGNVDSIKDQLTMMDSKIDNTYSLKEIKRNLTPCFTDLQNNLDNIRECANHQTIITDDVLNLAKLEQKKVVLENHPYELTTTIQTVINMFSASIKKKGLQLQLNLPDTAIWIKSDAKSLKQILINLLSNAIKFTKEGYIALSLIELSETTNQAEYQISIKDTGIGITTEQETRLFQRYEQANTNTANHYGGSGLGLSISLELAKLLGGRIDVHSQFGEGTIFTLTMLVEKLSEQEKKSILSSQNRMIENVQFDPLNMQSSQPTLIVENNSINQEILKRILTNAGYFCEVAINGQAAVEKYQVFPYRLIWMDIEMPEMNGYEATQAIRKIEQKDNRSPAYIICLSANNSDESKAQARDSGMNHYLTKPFKKQEILNLLAQVNQEINLLPMLKQQKNFSVKHEEKMFINSTQQTELIKIVELDEKKNTNGLQIKTKKRKKSLEFWLTSDTQKKINLVAKRENNLN